MKVVIIEDEPISQEFLVFLLRNKYPDVEIVKILDSVQESVEFLKENNSDLIFMDVHLKDGECFDIFEQVKILTPIIFTTAYDEYAIKAFEVNGISYILKPINEENISKAIEKYKTINESNFNYDQIEKLLSLKKSDKCYKKRLVVKLGDKIIIVEESNIAYFIVQSKTSYLYTKDNNKYIVDPSLDFISKQLDPQHFFRISRECYVRFDSIKEISKHIKGRLRITLEPEYVSDIIISQERAAEFLKWIDGE